MWETHEGEQGEKGPALGPDGPLAEEGVGDRPNVLGGVVEVDDLDPQSRRSPTRWQRVAREPLMTSPM